MKYLGDKPRGTRPAQPCRARQSTRYASSGCSTASASDLKPPRSAPSRLASWCQKPTQPERVRRVANKMTPTGMATGSRVRAVTTPAPTCVSPAFLERQAHEPVGQCHGPCVSRGTTTTGRSYHILLIVVIVIVFVTTSHVSVFHAVKLASRCSLAVKSHNTHYERARPNEKHTNRSIGDEKIVSVGTA